MPEKLPKRTPKDPEFKDIISLYFADQPSGDFSINPGLQVGQTQLEIDVVVRASESLSITEIGSQLTNTPFFFLAYLNALEFKSVNDKLTLADFYRISARALLAAATYYETRANDTGMPKKAGRGKKKQPEPARVASCIVCANYPQSVQDQLQVPFAPLQGQPKGFYYRSVAGEAYLPSYLIVCSELPLEEKYYPLLVFAAGKKLTQFIELAIDLELEVFVKYLTKLYSDEVSITYSKMKQGGKLATLAEQKRVAKTLTEIVEPEVLVEILADNVEPEVLVEVLNEKVTPERLIEILGGVLSPEKLIDVLTKSIGVAQTAKLLGPQRLVEMLKSLQPYMSKDDLKKLLEN